MIHQQGKWPTKIIVDDEPTRRIRLNRSMSQPTEEVQRRDPLMHRHNQHDQSVLEPLQQHDGITLLQVCAPNLLLQCTCCAIKKI